MKTYYTPQGGLPGQDTLLSDRAVFTESYAVIPKGTMRDIVTSALPFWNNSRFWVLARPLSGFAETFSHYIAEVSPGGGSARPDVDPTAQAVLFVTSGTGTLRLGDDNHHLKSGSYAFLAPDTSWSLSCGDDEQLTFHWIRKRHQTLDGLPRPDSFVTHEAEATVSEMPGTDGRWSTTRFVDPADLRHDMHVNIVNFEPGAHIPFMETHVMEHGLYVLEGRAVYRLNRDWVEVEAGDYMWLRAFCPQACYAGGPERFRYLLYKDVNRHMAL